MPASFWVALFVLVLNDHVLKGSGTLPAVVTGKLSDFAGLIVAPLLLCAVLSVRTDRGRGAALGFVALGFAAVKLSPACAQDAGRMLTALGVPSRIWCDPTDLIAFAILPWAALLARRVHPMPVRLSRSVAVAGAALACVATSSDGPSEIEVRGPFLINWTRRSIEATVSRRWTACDQPGSNSEAFAQEVQYTIGPAAMQEIGWDLGAADASFGGDCALADIRVADETIRVAWGARVAEPTVHNLEGFYGAYRVSAGDDWAFERGITVYGSAESPSFELGALLRQDGVEP